LRCQQGVGQGQNRDHRGGEKIGDGLKENKCLTGVVGGNEQYSWRGPILVLRRNGPTSYSDIQGSDLKMLRKYFTDRMSRKRKRSDNKELACNFKHSRLNASSGFKAVMISCAGDMKEFGHAKFSQVTINDGPVTSKLFDGPRTSISDRLGFMLEFYRYDSGIVNNSWEGPKEENALEHHSNPEIHTLLTEAHACYLWGTAGGFQKSTPGSFVVLRADRRELHPYHMEALERFIGQAVLPTMEAVIENCRTGQILFGKQSAKKSSVAAEFITKDRFETFFLGYKKLKIEEGYESWAKIKSPFST
jgi:hypothetical protein